MKSYKLFATGSVLAMVVVFAFVFSIAAIPSHAFAQEEWSGDLGGWSGDLGSWSGDCGCDQWSGDTGTWSGDMGQWSGDCGCDQWSGDYGNGCDLDCSGYTNDCGCDNGYGYDDACGCYDNSYDPVDTYYDDTCQCYEYGSSGYSSGSSGGASAHTSMPAYSASGYSMVRPMTFGSPSYPTYSTPNYSTPTYNAPAKPVQGGSVSNITNTTVTNTNVDNSINGSFNNYNSGNTVVTLGQATQQYPIAYNYPNYPTYQNPSCSIYQAQASGSGVTAAYLSWTSQNATSAYLSNVGSVSVNGSKTVWPTNSATYVLTVYGQNGQSAQCQTTVNAQAPYVSLTQIPYTGFDFGTVGNAIYWSLLASFAVAAAYLAIYFIPRTAFGGTFAFAGAMLPKRTARAYAPVVAPKAPILVEKETAASIVASKVAPIVETIRRGTLDTMAIIASKDGSMPKIVISRD